MMVDHDDAYYGRGGATFDKRTEVASVEQPDENTHLVSIERRQEHNPNDPSQSQKSKMQTGSRNSNHAAHFFSSNAPSK